MIKGKQLEFDFCCDMCKDMDKLQDKQKEKVHDENHVGSTVFKVIKSFAEAHRLALQRHVKRDERR